MHPRFEDLFMAGETRPNSSLRWTFGRHDLNDSARALFAHLDQVFAVLESDRHTFLTTIELDVERGRFPEVLLQYFGDEATADEDAVFVAPIHGVRSCGRLTFESRIGQVARVLRYDEGWRWGSCLRVWGFQVRNELVNTVIELSPFDHSGAPALDALRDASRMAWVTSPDLDALAVWVEESTLDLEEALKRMGNLTA